MLRLKCPLQLSSAPLDVRHDTPPSSLYLPDDIIRSICLQAQVPLPKRSTQEDPVRYADLAQPVLVAMMRVSKVSQPSSDRCRVADWLKPSSGQRRRKGNRIGATDWSCLEDGLGKTNQTALPRNRRSHPLPRNHRGRHHRPLLSPFLRLRSRYTAHFARSEAQAACSLSAPSPRDSARTGRVPPRDSPSTKRAARHPKSDHR